MRKFHSTLAAGLVMMFAACAEPSATPDQGEAAASTASEIELSRGEAPRAATAADETCTVTDEGACHVGQCELGPHDTVQRITEVCCTGSVCETEFYRLCGC